jgi:phosphopantothenoylcysteine decarboxylase/phosphopantothenate--cysteine ligase
MDVLHGAKASGPLSGEVILITAGPTREPIDPVRFIGNRSSGKMGFALAEEAMRMGARVILISGPVAIPPPEGAETIRIETADEMRRAVALKMDEASIIIKAAAVADYRPKQVQVKKIKRREDLTLELEATADILVEMAKKRAQQLIVGFAAETDDALENARTKLKKKSLNAIVVNDVSQPGIGFDSDSNAVTVITATEEISLAKASKRDIARSILTLVAALKQKQRTGAVQ